MIYTFGEVVAHLSRYMDLRPGDMLTSGTPSGTAFEEGSDGAFLQTGDEVEVFVEGVGVLRNVVGAW
jgi:2-keto-4-pentenoate hydratase/2-oxohepta-3-ene-1,7-dioic acid hydratase in catechol pathway